MKKHHILTLMAALLLAPMAWAQPEPLPPYTLAVLQQMYPGISPLGHTVGEGKMFFAYAAPLGQPTAAGTHRLIVLTQDVEAEAPDGRSYLSTITGFVYPSFAGWVTRNGQTLLQLETGYGPREHQYIALSSGALRRMDFMTE